MAATELPADGDGHLRAVTQVDLPDRVAALADAYDEQFHDRDRFLWQWIYSLFPEFTLSSVAEVHAAHVRSQKTILTMYVTVLDDLVETHGDRATFREACKCHQQGLEPDAERRTVDIETMSFVERVWEEFEDGLGDAPRYEEFADIIAYDLDQTMNAIEYSAVVSDNPGIANLTGARRYDSHNMVMFPYADVDLMYSPAFDLAEYGILRDLIWDLQEMARIGNWITTWERELVEGDYSSGVVVTALQEGVVTPEELEEGEPEVAAAKIREAGIVEQFRQRWAALDRTVRDRDADADSVDLDALACGMETVFEYHLASEGLK